MIKAKSLVFYIFMILIITIFLASLGYAKIPKELVLYLSFDEGSGKVIKDLSENGNDGENHGAEWVDGKYGKALEYSGVDSWITVPDTPQLNFGPKESLTAQCWGKITDAPSGQGNLLAKYAVGAGTTPFYGMFHNANNKLHAYVRDAGGTSVNPWSKNEINDDEWHHFALIRDTENKKVYLYVDGNKDFEGADTTNDLTNDVPLAIGRHTGEFLRGIVDEVMLWRKALSEAEVKESMEEPDKFFAVLSYNKLASTWGNIKNSQ